MAWKTRGKYLNKIDVSWVHARGELRKMFARILIGKINDKKRGILLIYFQILGKQEERDFFFSK